MVAIAGLVLAGAGAGCANSSSAATSSDTSAFVNQVHQQEPDIGNYRSDSRLVALGRAVCNDLAAGVSVQNIADRLSSPGLPAPDLGAVMTTAGQVLCPKYASAFSGATP